MKFTSICAVLALVSAVGLLASHEEPPKVLEVKRTVGQVEPSGTAITLYTRSFGLDTPEGVNEFYSRFRNYDRDVVGPASHSQIPKRAQEFTKTKGYRQMYGQEMTLTGEYFVLTGPSHRIETVEEKQKRVSNEERLQMLLGVAESNYVALTSRLLVGEFMDWSDSPAHIYIVPNSKMWLRLRSAESADYIAATYCVQDPVRDFALLDDPACTEYVPQVLAYAISEQIVKEYCRIISGKPNATLPLFIMTGIAGETSGLEAAVPPPAFAPYQVPDVTIGKKVRKIKRPNLGIMLPLKQKRLIPFAELMETKEVPETPEMRYVLLRESRAVVGKLWKESPLGMLSLLRNLASGKSFEKEFCLSYCDMQRGIIGQEVKESAPSTNVVVVGSAELRGLEKASNLLFYEMTQEKMTADIVKAQKAKAEAAKNGGAKPAEGAEAAPAETPEAAAPAEAEKPAETPAAPAEGEKPAEAPAAPAEETKA